MRLLRKDTWPCTSVETPRFLLRKCGRHYGTTNRQGPDLGGRYGVPRSEAGPNGMASALSMTLVFDIYHNMARGRRPSGLGIGQIVEILDADFGRTEDACLRDAFR